MRRKKNHFLIRVTRLAVIVPIVCVVIPLLFLIQEIKGEPTGATLNVLSNDTIATSPGTRQDQGGYIYVMTLDGLQQNNDWKAYVGNVTGALTLDDSSGFTIYDWEILESSLAGEVYASVNSSISWSTINCSNSTVISMVDGEFGFPASDPDTITNTFNVTIHDAMQIGTVSIPADNCSSVLPWVNDTYQVENSTNATFEEVLLADASYSLVYAQNINQDEDSFRNGTTYDYQIILPENGTVTTGTTYYFWVEIG